ncbi:hypothetical protein [Candidatus Methylocalor cossyra]|uniref:Transporter n=1 Tax=Candidatus Methylocalor cossyra TaxID=3108543 RepID=A0ABP1C9G3_9GAMM
MKSGRSWLSLLAGSLVLAAGAAPADTVIDGTEHLASDRPEAWGMNYVTSITLFTGLGVPRSREFGDLELGAELGWVPALSEEQRRIGFNGTKVEDLNKAPLFGRPRLTLGLPGRFALTLSYLPPIRVFGVKPNLFAFALERPLYEAGPWTFGARLYGQIGEVEGAFTCPGKVAKFPPGSAENLYGCQGASADRSSQRYAGLELSGAYRIAALGGLTPYLAVAGNLLDTQVQVRAQTFGVPDRRRLVAQTWTFSLSAGLVYPVDDRLSLSVGLFYSPLWVTRPPASSSDNDGLFNVRALVSYRWR